MKPRSLTPLCLISRSSSRSTAWENMAWESANARWCTQPGSVGVRSGSGVRSSLVNTVISRPSPGSKYRWLSAALSRFGCSNTKGIPSTPSQKPIDVRRSAPTIVMWWTPCVCSLRICPRLVLDELGFVLASREAPPRDELDGGLDHQQLPQSGANRLGQRGVRLEVGRELDADRKRRPLLDPPRA